MTVDLRVAPERAPTHGTGRGAAVSARANIPSLAEPAEVLISATIEDFDRSEWDLLFENEIEDWHYLRALERARLEHCEPLYFAIRSRGRYVAAVPAFVGRRALGASWRAPARRRLGRERMLVLGSPFADACRAGFTPRASASERARLTAGLVRAAQDHARHLGLDGLLVSGADASLEDLWDAACAPLRLVRVRGAQVARLALPLWSFDDYLSCFDDALRGPLLSACAASSRYERSWRIDLDRDLDGILALCREAGLPELNRAYFENLLGPGSVCANGVVAKLDGQPVGFSLVLHDARLLREQFTVVSRRAERPLVGALLWMETIRFCLECGIRTYESSSDWSIAAAEPHELVQRSGWLGTHRSLRDWCYETVGRVLGVDLRAR